MCYKKIYFVILFVFIIAGLLSACGRVQQSPSEKSDGITVEMVVEPEQPAVGPSTLIFTLTDESGKSINNATLKVEGNMTHAGMAPVKAEVTTRGNGRYEVPFEWSMGGDWLVTVNITLPDGAEISREFPIRVSGEMSQ